MGGTHRAAGTVLRARSRELRAAGIGALVGVTVLALVPGSPLIELLNGSPGPAAVGQTAEADPSLRASTVSATDRSRTGSAATDPATSGPATADPATADSAPDDSVDLPTTAGLQAALREPLSAPALGGSVGIVVQDLATGRLLLDRSGSERRPSASTAKLVTAVSALHHLGPHAEIATTTVTGSRPDQVVLVGGGDPTLTIDGGGAYPGSASLLDLARDTAEALHADGRTSVELVLDDAAFTGPATGPDWEAGDLTNGTIAPVSALTVDAARREPGGRLRHIDPAGAAGDDFARLLARFDITVTSIEAGSAPAGADRLAEVSSPSVAGLVERMLLVSDNDVAEALARLAGAAAGTGSDFAGGAAAAGQALAALGLDPSGLVLADGSGLSRQNVVSPALLVDLLAAAASPDRPELAPVLSGLPVAGVTGTLRNRFDDAELRVGRGLARAKTGTLTGAHGMAGTVVDAEGRTLVFAILADDTAAAFGPTRTALDGLVSTLARCGCRAGAPAGP